MYAVDLTYPLPEHNLACDEALLDMCEEGFDGEILRFWEPRQHFVVLGYSNSTAAEVDLDACQLQGIPVSRRYSGGGTVLQGPGCLNYSLILRIHDSGPLSTITGTTSAVLERNAEALQPLVADRIVVRGYSDLTVNRAKFSGNAQRRRHRFLLFHGTFLLNFDIQRTEDFLRMPARQPDYREQRGHLKFMVNLRLPPDEVRQALRAQWGASSPLRFIPENAIRQLAQQRYADTSWIFRR